MTLRRRSTRRGFKLRSIMPWQHRDGLHQSHQSVQSRSSGGANALSLADYSSGSFVNYEAMAAQYDAFRTSNSMPVVGMMHYEGAPQWAVGHNGVNGTDHCLRNSTQSGQLRASPLTRLAGQNRACQSSAGSNAGDGNTIRTTTATRRIPAVTSPWSRRLIIRRSRQ
jgi:hypothetical protein